MAGENFEFYLAQMAKNAFKLSTMAGENFEFYLAQMAKNAFKLSTMIGENHHSQTFSLTPCTQK